MATTKVPERIWIETDTAYYRIVYKDRKIRDGEVEYIRADLVATPAQGEDMKLDPNADFRTRMEVTKLFQESSNSLPAPAQGDSRAAAEEIFEYVARWFTGEKDPVKVNNTVKDFAAIITRHCEVKLSKFQCQECGSTNLLEDVTDKIFPTCVR